VAWRELVTRVARSAGLVVHRWPANRFDAAGDSLTLLRQAGYEPATIIDCGANEGQFAHLVTTIFPSATIHVIEPQEACWPALDVFAQRRGRTCVHRLAVTEPGVGRVRMHREGSEASTGAFVVGADEKYPTSLEAASTTLDGLFADTVSRGERALLKLDIEGHEVAALQGATRLLTAVEVVYSEVRFYDITRSGRPVFGDVARLLAGHGFDLYDFGMLASRPRDRRLRIGDAMFVRRDSPLATDVSWD